MSAAFVVALFAFLAWLVWIDGNSMPSRIAVILLMAALFSMPLRAAL